MQVEIFCLNVHCHRPQEFRVRRCAVRDTAHAMLEALVFHANHEGHRMKVTLDGQPVGIDLTAEEPR